jgi:hypothetical protein
MLFHFTLKKPVPAQLGSLFFDGFTLLQVCSSSSDIFSHSREKRGEKNIIEIKALFKFVA